MFKLVFVLAVSAVFAAPKIYATVEDAMKAAEEELSRLGEVVATPDATSAKAEKEAMQLVGQAERDPVHEGLTGATVNLGSVEDVVDHSVNTPAVESSTPPTAVASNEVPMAKHSSNHRISEDHKVPHMTESKPVAHHHEEVVDVASHLLDDDEGFVSGGSRPSAPQYFNTGFPQTQTPFLSGLQSPELNTNEMGMPQQFMGMGMGMGMTPPQQGAPQFPQFQMPQMPMMGMAGPQQMPLSGMPMGAQMPQFQMPMMGMQQQQPQFQMPQMNMGTQMPQLPMPNLAQIQQLMDQFKATIPNLPRLDSVVQSGLFQNIQPNGNVLAHKSKKHQANSFLQSDLPARLAREGKRTQNEQQQHSPWEMMLAQQGQGTLPQMPQMPQMPNMMMNPFGQASNGGQNNMPMMMPNMMMNPFGQASNGGQNNMPMMMPNMMMNPFGGMMQNMPSPMGFNPFGQQQQQQQQQDDKAEDEAEEEGQVAMDEPIVPLHLRHAAKKPTPSMPKHHIGNMHINGKPSAKVQHVENLKEEDRDAFGDEEVKVSKQHTAAKKSVHSAKFHKKH
eukprot:c9030_g1_i1.p1 GENE.c9030_g1_i1~~c9030_g1_i1.p1  ORF type:complete len:566 (+),score=161.35 c9030_g1_i1:27-1700(+)